MFSTTKYELVKALHESNNGYVPDYNNPFNEYDNVIGECFEKYFVSGCLYKLGEIDIPCFQCPDFYGEPVKNPCCLDKTQECTECYFLSCTKYPLGYAEDMYWLPRPITYLYELGKNYNLNCDSPNVPWDCCCGCGLGGCKVPHY